MEFHLYLPQMRLTFDQIVERARNAEAAGFLGIAGMDHFAPPLAVDQPMFEAHVTTVGVAAHTESLIVGNLVLCDAFRHPSMLAKECVSIDHVSGGRYELGLGWGSVVDEFDIFGAQPTDAKARLRRMRETLEILKALWSGETVDYKGEYFTLRGARQLPTPVRDIPIVIGGSGPNTMKLVAEFADWWNVHVGIIDSFAGARDRAGSARVSLQHMVALIPSEAERESVTSLAVKRFGHSRPAIGTTSELVDHFGVLGEQGVERVYAWFCDFAAPWMTPG
jgi:alkanesulfonate monooxygenase SsuD/methylene tetrahydromethanopterin reductase-like flavin-dependent oxidoreductase (luciferase family)